MCEKLNAAIINPNESSHHFQQQILNLENQVNQMLRTKTHNRELSEIKINDKDKIYVQILATDTFKKVKAPAVKFWGELEKKKHKNKKSMKILTYGRIFFFNRQKCGV